MTDTKDTIQEENQTASKETLESPSSNEDREKKRMETNRIRAKQIRKRKKEMEEDMRNQSVRLTLENNTLRTQLQVQEAEIKLLRNNMVSSICTLIFAAVFVEIRSVSDIVFAKLSTQSLLHISLPNLYSLPKNR
jgi:hypothetical protein